MSPSEQDIVVRLRSFAKNWHRCTDGPAGWLLFPEHYEDAAAEIERLRAALADSREQAVKPFVEAGLALPDGTPRKVLGSVQKTEDGAIIMPDATAYAVRFHPGGWRTGEPERTCVSSVGIYGSWRTTAFQDPVSIKSLWSTQEAADAEQARLDAEREAALASKEPRE